MTVINRYQQEQIAQMIYEERCPEGLPPWEEAPPEARKRLLELAANIMLFLFEDPLLPQPEAA